jgi:hypothetical protein
VYVPQHKTTDDGILFRVNRDNQQVNFIDLVGGLESAAWEHCTITTDATGSVIYGLNYAYEYNDTFAIEPDLSAIRWIGNVAYGGVAYGSGMLDIGAPLPQFLSSADLSLLSNLLFFFQPRWRIACTCD